MNQQELSERQGEILKRIAGDDLPIKPYIGLTGRESMDFYRVGTAKRALLDYATLLTHEQAAEYIRSVMAFYEAATPEDIAILNLETSLCKHCGEHLTPDEFYPVSSTTGRVGVETHANQHTGEITTIYCKKCIQIVPHCAFRKDRPGYVYLAMQGDLCKIGMSQNPQKRIDGLKSEYPGIALLHYFPCKDVYATETHLHTIYTHRHEFGEFFSLSDQEVERIMAEVGE